MILANVGNIAMHPFCKIIAFPVNYEVFHSLKICPFRNETESMHSVIEIKVKILSPGKNADKLMCLGPFAFFQIELYGYERDLMTSSLVLLMMEELRHTK